jgi:hypothetical protein
VNHIPHLLMTLSATSAGVGMGALSKSDVVAWTGIWIGVATAVINFFFWAYTQWGKTQREQYALWRDERGKEEVAAQSARGAAALRQAATDDATALRDDRTADAAAKRADRTADALAERVDRASDYAQRRYQDQDAADPAVVSVPITDLVVAVPVPPTVSPVTNGA